MMIEREFVYVMRCGEVVTVDYSCCANDSPAGRVVMGEMLHSNYTAPLFVYPSTSGRHAVTDR